MHDPVAGTIAGVPAFLALWVATLLSLGLFGSRIWRYVKVLKTARPEVRWDHPGARLRLFIEHVLLQKKFVREPWIGLAHLVLFWSFVCYATTFWWNLIRGLFPALPLPYAEQIPAIGKWLEIFAVLGLAALAVAAVRRYVFTPERLVRSADASLILVLIAVVLSSYLAGALATSADAKRIAWWVHMFTVLGFLAYLPYSKHLHLLAAPFSVFFTALQRTGMPAPSDGAARREEFTWRQLFSGLACAECGRCDRSCPAFQSGYPLSPKDLMEHTKRAVRGENGGALLPPEALWSCMTCMACMERCMCFNEHLPLIIEMRRRLVVEGQVDGALQDALTKLNRYGNSFGSPARARTKWTQGLSVPVRDARKEAVEYLWFVGDYASFDPRVQPSTRALAKLLNAAKVDFGTLAEAEQNSGNDARRAGEEGLFEVLMEKNAAAIAKTRHRWIITSDPHSYHALKNEYHWTNGHSPVLHHSELLERLMGEGRLSVRRPLRGALTYHDPCYLGRYNGVYDAPRRVLTAIGARVEEMPRRREQSYCCGAGGGRIWMEDTVKVRERPAEARVREAASLGVDCLAVSCPKDLVMFQDAIKTTGLEGRLQVRELAELVAEACLAEA